MNDTNVLTEWERRQAAEDLRAGADTIERNGWHQGSYYKRSFPLEPKDCAVCAMGGINIAVSGHPLGLGAAGRRANAMEALEARTGYLARWNDADGQTAEVVIKTMRDCADALEAGSL